MAKTNNRSQRALGYTWIERKKDNAGFYNDSNRTEKVFIYSNKIKERK